MADLGPEERELFESAATSLYEEAAEAGGLKDSDPRLRPDGELRPALDLLTSLNLLVHDEDNSTYVPVDPSTVQSHVVTPLSQRGAEMLTESSEWARAFGGLSQAWRRSPGAVRGPISEFHTQAIGVFISGAVAEAEEELLTAQPQAGRERASLKAALARDKAALDRGVRMRTLYQHSARRHSTTRGYVAEVTALGAEVRTLDEFFNRMIVVDRRLAIIPGPSGDTVAIAVQEPALVAYLVDVFERAWERARPYTTTERSMMNDIAREQRAMTIRMLIEGHSDPVSAKRLGVSARTFAGYVAELKAEYDADTRFQLGYTMGQRGVSGREDE
ncbi:MAG TPA: LuxR family transcriptional regulator [Nocardioides sp.]|nr:LuxR family transcriptional regulator [Nocardioides sp.]